MVFHCLCDAISTGVRGEVVLNSLFKTPTKCTSISLLLCINRPLHMFRFYVKPSSGGTKTTFIPHLMLLLPLYLCNIFVCKLHSLTKSEYKTYIKTHRFLYVLYSDFVSECNLHIKILHKCNGRSNIGFGMTVVFVPPEDGFT
jgi:hypothetical protein